MYASYFGKFFLVFLMSGIGPVNQSTVPAAMPSAPAWLPDSATKRIFLTFGSPPQYLGFAA